MLKALLAEVPSAPPAAVSANAETAPVADQFDGRTPTSIEVRRKLWHK